LGSIFIIYKGIMRIFNNFDTELKKNEYEWAVKIYWKDKVFLIQRYVAFWIIRWIIPFILIFIINIGLFMLLFFLESVKPLFDVLFWILIIIDIIILYKFFNLYLDYKFDYTLVTPYGIVTHKQKGLFYSKVKDLPTSKIRSTQLYRSWILWNIFSYWVIEILTDGWLWDENDDGSSQAGKTKLSYVYNPWQALKTIIQIIHVSNKRDND
jgi:hypothetical protein